MQRPIILEGQPFDWAEGEKNMLKVVDENGELNWRAAFSADPGVLVSAGSSVPCGCVVEAGEPNHFNFSKKRESAIDH